MKKIIKSVVTPKQALRVPAPSPNSKIGKRIVGAKQETPASTSAGKANPKTLKIEGLVDGSVGKGAAPKAASTSTGINIGKTTGMRVMAFQDMTLARNDEPKYRLTDTELAKLWREEFPNSRAVQNGRITEEIVRGVRNLYNQGTQGHGTPGRVFSSVPYVIENGKRVPSVYTRTRKTAGDEAAQPTTAQPTKPAAAVAKKSVVKTVAKKGVTSTALPVPNRARLVARKSA